MKLGVIGCGKMGTAMIAGAVRAGMLDPQGVAGFDPLPAALAAFTAATQARATASVAGLVGSCERLLLCVRPADMPAVLADLSAAASGPVTVVSIAAGVTTAAIEAGLPEGSRVVRCMPNTPALVGKGAAGFCGGRHAQAADLAFARDLLGAVGLAIEVPEALMDAVTGLSGSGPAFAFLVIEALADGGVRCGLPRATALELAAQTLLGAAALTLESGEHPAVLRDRVASPGGTTIAGLAELEHHGVRAAMIAAVAAAARRSAELGSAPDPQ